MLTKKEANRLRGLVVYLAACEREAAFAGAQSPEEAQYLRDELENARRNCYDEIIILTAPAPLR